MGTLFQGLRGSNRGLQFESWDGARATSESDWNATLTGAASAATRLASMASRDGATPASGSHSCWSPSACWRGRHNIEPFDTPRCPPPRRSPRRWPLPKRYRSRCRLQLRLRWTSPPVPARPHRAILAQAVARAAALLAIPIEAGHRAHRRRRPSPGQEHRRLNRSLVRADREQTLSLPRLRPNLGRRSRRPNQTRHRASCCRDKTGSRASPCRPRRHHPHAR